VARGTAEIPSAGAVAEAECANCIGGRCLGGEPCVVLQGRPCKYFEAAVLPRHPAVRGYGEAFVAEATKRCARCGGEFPARSHRARWCPVCAADVRREQTRQRAARRRASE